MVAKILIHIIECVFSIIYIVLIWPVYVENDFIYGCLWCIGYLLIIAFYSGISALIPAMQIACNVSGERKTKRRTRMLSQIPWISFTIFIIFAFGKNLGFFACLPIVIPNLTYFIYLVYRSSTQSSF